MLTGSKVQTVGSDANNTVRRLVQVAVNGLPQMFDSNSQLFCYKLKRTDRGLVREGLSHRYTMMTLMGFHRLRQSGVAAPIELDRVLEQLLANLDWINNLGDLGLLLWTCALMAPERLEELNRRLELGAASSRYPDATRRCTMELSWFLAGLSHWALAQPDAAPKLRHQAFETYGLVSENLGPNRIFGHQGANKSLSGMLRGRIGSFADQVYPIYAFSKFYEAYQESAALQRALDCGHAICEAQGALGQWWWHYDLRSGRVFEQFPVFSVHQHAMAPMTLFALSQASKVNFDAYIYKGLDWISRRNELSFEMEDASASVVWRCIYRPAVDRYAAFLRTRTRGLPRGLKVLFECRPYELGWLLYAFAGLR
jgi:hypothetical protein